MLISIRADVYNFLNSQPHYYQTRRHLILSFLSSPLLSLAACSDLNSPATGRVELTLYVLLGFSCVPVWNIFAAALTPPALILVVLMGAAYSIGIVFFLLAEYRPIYHSVWHVFVMIGAALTWFNVYFFIVAEEINLSKVWFQK